MLAYHRCRCLTTGSPPKAFFPQATWPSVTDKAFASFVELSKSSPHATSGDHSTRFFMGNFFTDVISHDPRLSLPTRVADPLLLEPVTRRLVHQIIDAAGQMGIEVMVYETFRSQSRQQDLFNNGATKLRQVGVHHYGLACDIVRTVAGGAPGEGGVAFFGPRAPMRGPLL